MGGAARPDPSASRHHHRHHRLWSVLHEPIHVVDRATRIGRALLEQSPTIRLPNFTTISTADLALLFRLYDDEFFSGLLASLILEDRATLTFRVSSRMTRSAGTTCFRKERRRTSQGAEESIFYEIAISTVLLFASFRESSRAVTVGGVAVNNRLEALQRVFEHELVHLSEFLATGRSSCSERNFRDLSRRIFNHEGVRHDMITPREVAAATFGIRVGDPVGFVFEGVPRVGRVNRITKRATVLVEDRNGRPFRDGRTYATYYVPVESLSRADLDSSP